MEPRLLHILKRYTFGRSHFTWPLAAHEVILAEGAPVETYLVTNGREHFTNFVEYERLYGREPGPTVPYAPEYAGYSGGRALE